MSKSSPDSNIASLVHHLFGEKPFAALNPGSYHDSYHAMYVAEVVAAVAGRRKREPARRLFLAQVALLHDADPRPALPPTPASVPRTLEWMWLRKEHLQQHLCWTDTAFDTALALVARSDFPFDDTPRSNDTMFDGLSPYEVYRNLLERLEPADRELAFEDAQIMRFADQSANYCRDYATASQSVNDLSREMQSAGVPMSRWDLDTGTFIENIASDCGWDVRVKKELGIQGRVFSLAELRHSMLASMRENLDRNRDLFRQERGDRQAAV